MRTVKNQRICQNVLLSCWSAGLGGLHGDLGALSTSSRPSSIGQWQRGRWIVWFIGSNGLQEETWTFGTKQWIQCLGRRRMLGDDLAWREEDLFRWSRSRSMCSQEDVEAQFFWDRSLEDSIMASLPFLRWRLLLDHQSYLPQGEHAGWHPYCARFKLFLCVKVKQCARAGRWGSCLQGYQHLPAVKLCSHLLTLRWLLSLSVSPKQNYHGIVTACSVSWRQTFPQERQRVAIGVLDKIHCEKEALTLSHDPQGRWTVIAAVLKGDKWTLVH